MSNISTVYNAFIDRVEAVLPTHNRMSNPYDPERNQVLQLQKGFGVQIKPATNAGTTLSCVLTLERSLTLVLTQEYFALEFDRDGKQTAELALMEDLFLVVGDLEGDPRMGLSSGITGVDFDSDGGIESLFADAKSFYKVEANFTIQYQEDLN